MTPTEPARETPTPRTDKECEKTNGDYYLEGYVDSDFARTLERENAQLRAEVELLRHWVRMNGKHAFVCTARIGQELMPCTCGLAEILK